MEPHDRDVGGLSPIMGTVDMNAPRTDALRALGSMLASESGRAILGENKPSPDTPVVPTDSEELLRDVLLLAMQYPPPVVLAVHFRPSDAKQVVGRIGLLVLSSGDIGDRAASSAPPLDASINASIGMLFDTVMNECAQGMAITVNLLWGQSLTRRPDSLFDEGRLVH